MNAAEIEALVEQVGDEILGRLGLPASALAEAGLAREAPASAWPLPEGGYASALELVYGAPQASATEVSETCRRARQAALAVVWAPVSLIPVAVSALSGAPTRAGALIDFPHGAASTGARLADLEIALRLGAELVNLILGAGRARSGEPDVIQAEVRAAAALCAGAGVPLAVTLEADLLSEQDLARAAAAALAGGADALCCSTGRHGHVFASPRWITLLREIAGGRAVVIAAGRIGGFGHAAALISAGADRIAADDPWAILAQAPAP